MSAQLARDVLLRRRRQLLVDGASAVQRIERFTRGERVHVRPVVAQRGKGVVEPQHVLALVLRNPQRAHRVDRHRVLGRVRKRVEDVSRRLHAAKARVKGQQRIAQLCRPRARGAVAIECAVQRLSAALVILELERRQRQNVAHLGCARYSRSASPPCARLSHAFIIEPNRRCACSTRPKRHKSR